MIAATFRDKRAHTKPWCTHPIPHPQPGPVGDSDGPEQALPTDTAARDAKVVQIIQPDSQNSRSNAERRGLGRNEGGGGADEGEKAGGSLHGGQKEGFPTI